MKWKCKDGRKIEIKELGDNHLKSINAMLKRNGFCHSDTYFSALAYMSDAPDGAYDAISGEIDTWKHSSMTDAIFDEIEERGLKGKDNERI